ncbi:hypothetical protein E1B28_008601 [Marasmius oreades]|uniref:RecA family profile 1 domain-containing protein n=1 Tax=Marasmius oreades TaxID=181124 RepID=A0A9P7RYW1_9AGAR|nr:uncharacterized protein E1B28_008601 [Marasmius oreades]KAG7092235.1 hypothetical protein E1B28_008601 [Marasmius oreades]
MISNSTLTSSHKQILRKGNVSTITDLVFTPATELARRCKVSPLEIKGIVDAFCQAEPIKPQSLEEASNTTGICTTGDDVLDSALGGGVRTGMVWEVVGESSAGKTQFALQLSLCVQLPQELGGLAGSSCYMMTSAQLPTERLVQMSESHPKLATCGLRDVHTMSVPTIPVLLSALQRALPLFIEESNVPVKLLVIDALGELFHTSSKTSTHTLVERSKNITEISQLLHKLAYSHDMIILVLNEVVDAFERGPGFKGIENLGLPYAEQSRWFSQPEGTVGEARKEASLGLVWANQVNVRIMLSRTGRRRYEQNQKRQKLDRPDSTLIRRLSVIFSSVASPTSVDYIVDTPGVSCLVPLSSMQGKSLNRGPTMAEPGPNQLVPLDIGTLQDDIPDEEDWDQYWNTDEITTEMYLSIDLES